jgi:hypothetical protein
MTPIQINRAITKLIGGNLCQTGKDFHYCSICSQEVDANHAFEHPVTLIKREQINYCYDLNAIQRVERWLKEGNYRNEPMYFNTYLDLLKETYGDDAMVATARQRAEVILKVV